MPTIIGTTNANVNHIVVEVHFFQFKRLLQEPITFTGGQAYGMDIALVVAVGGGVYVVVAAAAAAAVLSAEDIHRHLVQQVLPTSTIEDMASL